MVRQRRNAAKPVVASPKRKSPKPRPRAKRGAAPTSPVVVPSQVVLHLESKDISLRTADPERTSGEGINFPRAAMQWTYVVRSRQRWSSTQHTVEAQADAAAQLMQQLGVSPIEL